MPNLALAFDILARDRASATFNKVGDSAERAGKRGAGFGTLIKGAVTIAAGAIASAGIGAFFKDSIAEARESQKVGALTEQVIKSTGKAAKVTADQVGALSTAISNRTGIDDEAIQSGANLLLTFKNIRNEAGQGNDIFSQTTQIMTDMATAMGTEPKGAAIQLGKALNDPIKGIAALGRVGVTFSDSQKKTIKTLVESGDVMGAQKIILKELQSEFGGAAAASSTMGEKASVAFGNLKEQIGTALLPIIDKFAGMLTEKVIPAVSRFFTELQDGTGTGGQVRDVLEGVGSAVADVGRFLNEHRSIVAGVVGAYVAFKVAQVGMAAATAISLVWLKLHTVGTLENTIASKAAAAAAKVWAAGQWLVNAALIDNPIGIVVVAIAALVAGIVLAYQRSETFRNIVKGAFDAVGTAAVFLWDKAIRPYFKLIADLWLTVVGVIVHGAAAAFGWVPGVGPKLKKVVEEFDKLRRKVDDSLDGIGDEASKYGSEWARGLAQGINKNAHVPIAAAQGVANKIAAATRAAHDTHSPSRVADKLGRFWDQGLAQGLLGDSYRVTSAAARTAGQAVRVSAAVVSTPTPRVSGTALLDRGRVMQVRLHPDDIQAITRGTGGAVVDGFTYPARRVQGQYRNGPHS